MRGPSLAILACLAALFVTEAHATGTISCSSVTGGYATVSITQSFSVAPDVLSVTIVADGQEISTGDTGEGDAFVIQDFDDGTELRLVLTDLNVEAVLAEIHTVRIVEKGAEAHAGILRVAEGGAYAIVCEGP